MNRMGYNEPAFTDPEPGCRRFAIRAELAKPSLHFEKETAVEPDGGDSTATVPE
jgi:hypothetical protein